MTESPPSPNAVAPCPLTVRSALETPSLRGGAPEIISGSELLDREVRWVHVAESRDVAEVLKSGELLLSVGLLFVGNEAADRLAIAELADRDIAALFIELGAVMPSVPDFIASECQRRGVILVALHLPVPFIEVTEQLHTAIVNYKTTLLDSTQQLQEALTDLALAGAGVPEVLQAFAEMIGNPVVFEASHGGFEHQALNLLSEHEVAASWQAYCRGLPSAPTTLLEELVVEGRVVGRLVALALRAPFSAADSTAIGRAARVISLIMMRDAHANSVALRNQRGFLYALMERDLPAYRAEVRASGLGFTGPVLLPIGARLAPHRRGRPTGIEDRLWRRVWDDVSEDLSSRHAPGLLDHASTTETTLAILGMGGVADRASTAHRFAELVQRLAERHIGAPNSAVICVGPAAHTWQAAGDGLAACIEAMEGAVHAPPRPWHDAMDLDLDRLLWSLRENPDLERFSGLRLNKLIRYDRQRSTQLVTTLQVLLQQNGQKAETARALRMERQSLYTRVERIESLLGVDLADADVRLALHLALRIRRMGGGLGASSLSDAKM